MTAITTPGPSAPVHTNSWNGSRVPTCAWRPTLITGKAPKYKPSTSDPSPKRPPVLPPWPANRPTSSTACPYPDRSHREDAPRGHHLTAGATLPSTWTSNKPGTPFADIRVRKAIAHAINEDEIIEKVMRGQATTAHQCRMSPPSATASIKRLPYDPAMAKKLLAEAGYPNGFESRGRPQRPLCQR
jgi:hypothetical protein